MRINSSQHSIHVITLVMIAGGVSLSFRMQSDSSPTQSRQGSLFIDSRAIDERRLGDIGKVFN